MRKVVPLLLTVGLCSVVSWGQAAIWSDQGRTEKDGGISPTAAGCYSLADYGNVRLSGQFVLSPEASGGVLLRADAATAPGTSGAKVQMVDTGNPLFTFINPELASGTVRGHVPVAMAKLVPPGQPNRFEINAIGERVRVVINDQITFDANVAGLPAQGRLGLVAQNGEIVFRSLAVEALAADAQMPASPADLNKAQPGDNTPPAGFVALFNGRDLEGWKGLVASPPERAKMSAEQLAEAQKAADQRMRDHWKVVDGVLVFDGGGDSLCTIKDYGDFEMMVDWKILPHGDSGIYLRGSPQVQIWDTGDRPEGSGGLYNNEKNPNQPSVAADKPIGQWNHMRIKMIGEKVWVWLNDTLVVDNVTMENYWERDKPIYPTGQLELQNHGNTLWFKNVYVREITDPAAEK